MREMQTNLGSLKEEKDLYMKVLNLFMPRGPQGGETF